MSKADDRESAEHPLDKGAGLISYLDTPGWRRSQGGDCGLMG